MEKLGLKIDALSKVVVVIANGKRERALGKIYDVPIIIQGTLILITLEVIESINDTLLLGTDWCSMTNANIDFESQKLRLKYKGKRITVPITIGKADYSEIPYEYEEELDDQIDEMLEENSEEYEEESDLDERESF